MNDGNNVYNTVEYVKNCWYPWAGLLDADLDGDLDIFIIQDEGDVIFIFKSRFKSIWRNRITQGYLDVGDMSTSRTITIADYVMMEIRYICYKKIFN